MVSIISSLPTYPNKETLKGRKEGTTNPYPPVPQNKGSPSRERKDC